MEDEVSKQKQKQATRGSMEFLSSKPYVPPQWASHLNPIPSHIFSLAHLPTPIHKWNLPNLPNNTEVWLKRDDLSGMQLSGNKVRKLEFLMAEAVAQGADCVITIGGIQSNHCRATAVAAKYLHLDCFIILRTSKVLVDKDPGLTGNLLVERLVGAHVDLISKEEYAKLGSVTLTNLLKEKLLNEGRRPYVIPVGGSNSLGTWGYIEAIQEIEQQLQIGTSQIKFDDIVVACGRVMDSASFVRTKKLFKVKGDLKKWNKEDCGDIDVQKNKIIDELLRLDLKEEGGLNDEERSKHDLKTLLKKIALMEKMVGEKTPGHYS
uniref:Tryptophan synthase beta chain-like PALP domain-containing protein n=1 Tax=Quercus lobata TaxID=97700 RepID=A0A7N2MQR5_QUELO